MKAWIEELLGEDLGPDLFEALHDGSKLCIFLNKLQKDLVPKKFEKPTKMPFSQVQRSTLSQHVSIFSFQIDNINAFLKGCKDYGMQEKDLFETLDLHECQNKTMV